MMRRLAALGVLALVLASGAAAAMPQGVADAWREGNAAYEAGEFEKAARAYESILDRGYTAPEAEYNLANAYLKASDLGRAVLHYRRALRLDPAYANARSNLDYARSLTQDVRPDPASARFGWVGRIRLGPASAVRGIVLAVSLFFLVAGLRLRPWRDRLWATVLQGALGGLVLLGAAALVFELSQTRHTGEGVLVVEEAEVHAGPGDSHTVNFRLHEGAEVQLLRRAAGWRELKVSDGLQGWVPEDAVEEI